MSQHLTFLPSPCRLPHLCSSRRTCSGDSNSHCTFPSAASESGLAYSGSLNVYIVLLPKALSAQNCSGELPGPTTVMRPGTRVLPFQYVSQPGLGKLNCSSEQSRNTLSKILGASSAIQHGSSINPVYQFTYGRPHITSKDRELSVWKLR